MKLKPCPICKNEAYLDEYYEFLQNAENAEYLGESISCSVCDLRLIEYVRRIPGMSYKKHADLVVEARKRLVKKWNHRPAETAILAANPGAEELLNQVSFISTTDETDNAFDRASALLSAALESAKREGRRAFAEDLKKRFRFEHDELRALGWDLVSIVQTVDSLAEKEGHDAH